MKLNTLFLAVDHPDYDFGINLGILISGAMATPGSGVGTYITKFMIGLS